MEKSLQLVFKNAAGSTKIITISNPKENLTKANNCHRNNLPRYTRTLQR